ncbi:MAG: hypothetical protein FWG80_02055 [Alphaproteobacteria bacterium]|nr:hypothetical protein [Alphaproteobacteria bacterium]
MTRSQSLFTRNSFSKSNNYSIFTQKGEKMKIVMYGAIIGADPDTEQNSVLTIIC